MSRSRAGHARGHIRLSKLQYSDRDLTFSPVKSVSTLWAVADPHIAAQIEQAHQAAVQDALSFIERHARFTRQGRNGARQVNVRGLVCGRVHAPRLPSRRPGPAHACRGGEQGADPGRALAIHRRQGAVQGDRGGVGDLICSSFCQVGNGWAGHLAGSATGPVCLAAGVFGLGVLATHGQA
jgi:hypothetical protein